MVPSSLSISLHPISVTNPLVVLKRQPGSSAHTEGESDGSMDGNNVTLGIVLGIMLGESLIRDGLDEIDGILEGAVEGI